jgi:hypothetical protein
MEAVGAEVNEMLVIKKSSYQQQWYQKNQQRLSDKRKKLYAENPEYREQRLEASRRRRSGDQTPPVSPVPPDAPISFAQAAARLDRGVSTLREWRRNKYFPEPKRHNRAPWFTEHQVSLLKQLKDFFEVYGKRPGKVKEKQFKDVRAFIAANWN